MRKGDRANGVWKSIQRLNAHLTVQRAVGEPARDDLVARVQSRGLILWAAEFRVYFCQVHYRQLTCKTQLHSRNIGTN